MITHRWPRWLERALLGGPWRTSLVCWLLAHLAPARLRVHGALIVPDRRDRVIFPRLALGLFERGETRYLLGAVSSDCLFVDVGANCGYYAALAASRGARVVAIEPDPENFALLMRTAAASGERIRALPLAASDRRGTATLHRHPSNHGDNRLTVLSGARDSVGVRCARLDDCIAFDPRYPHLFLKIDVQGWEVRVLRGAASLIGAHPRVSILFEYQPSALRAAGESPLGLLGSLREQGFVLAGIDDAGRLHPLGDDLAALTKRFRGELFANFLALREPD